MNRQLSKTRGYIGGGNVAGILAVSPYKSPLDEYLTITGQAEAADEGREIFFRRRKALEPFAAEAFELHSGLKIARRNVRYEDPTHVYLRAEIDFETEDGCNGETKTVHPFAAKEWGTPGTDEIPVYVTAQAMHGLMLKPDAPATWVHALVGLDDDRVYRIERDPELIAGIRGREIAFWRDHVEKMVPPEPTNLEDLRRLFRDKGTPLEADGELLTDYNELRDLKARAKADEGAIEALELRIKLRLREASRLELEGRTLLTWKEQSTNRFDQKAFAADPPGSIRAVQACQHLPRFPTQVRERSECRTKNSRRPSPARRHRRQARTSPPAKPRHRSARSPACSPIRR